MADLRPFQAIMPARGLEDKIAALPYDVYNREEAKKIVENNPLSFLRIDRAETNFSDDISTYDECVYQKVNEILISMINEGKFVEDNKNCYYLYRQIMSGRSQTGIVACASVDDYCNGIIKKHENTREEKELDRINHISACNAQTGPIFLAFRSNNVLDTLISNKILETPLYDFTSDDEIRHSVWRFDSDNDINVIRTNFEKMNAIYIADGHHRCASAVKVALKRRIEGKIQESDYFMSVLFPQNQLKILDYNRVIKDYNNKSVKCILNEISEYFDVNEEDNQVKPEKKGTFGLYIDDKWYLLMIKEEFKTSDPVEGLDVSLLQKYILDRILGIKNPKIDHRIDFVGGIRGLDELERRVHTDCKIAFSMYPTSIEELFSVADAGLLMPPKSTWFEPKLRSGLFIHKI